MKTQAWGWLAAGVVAAALNASYHGGGLQWAHRIAARVEHNSGAVLALATGRADQFLAEAQVLTAKEDGSSCPLHKALTQLRSAMVNSDSDSDEVMTLADQVVISDREQAQLDRLTAQRDRMEARLSRVRAEFADFNPVVVRAQKFNCPRVRVAVPRMPRVKIPAMPEVHIENPGPGPV